jgi:hypothetical protein
VVQSVPVRKSLNIGQWHIGASLSSTRDIPGSSRIYLRDCLNSDTLTEYECVL